MGCGVGHRRSSDLMLLWLWPRPAAVALIGLLAWEISWAVGVTIKKKKKQKKKEKEREKQTLYQIRYRDGKYSHKKSSI